MIIENELNGKKIVYHDGTEFLIQVGKGKGAYKQTLKVIGNLSIAVMHYNLINVHSGYKKRLIAPGMNKPILARTIT